MSHSSPHARPSDQLGEPHRALRVAHVTEALGGGVVTSLARLACRQAEQGMHVTVYFTRRPDTPTPEGLREAFGPDVRFMEAPADCLTLMQHGRWIVNVVRQNLVGSADIIHFHSSMGGAFGRFALLGLRRQPASFYSPHGFPFLRTDYSASHRTVYRVIEKVLGKASKTSLVLVSQSEAAEALRALGAAHSFVVSNGVPIGHLPERDFVRTDSLPVIGMVGRVAYQKAPWQFAEVAEAFRGRARFVWIGDGDNQAWNDELTQAGVERTGWVPYAEAMKRLAAVDVLLFLTLWEGMPLAPLEAQAMGIPVVASKIVGNIDVVDDGETGFLVDSVDDAKLALERLLVQPGLAESFYRRALQIRQDRWSDTHIGEQSLDLYSGTLAPYSENHPEHAIIAPWRTLHS